MIFRKGILLVFSALAIVVFLSYSELIGMYFVNDDYTHLYNLQRGNLSIYPYHFYTIFLKPLWLLFGLNPHGYFVVAILLYFVAAICLYLLSLKIFVDRKLAFIVTLLFASGYVGQESMKMFIGDGLVLVTGLIFYLLGVLFFLVYQKEERVKYFLISLIFFLSTIEIAPHRYFGIVFVFLALDWFYFFKRKTNFKGLVARNILFLGVFLIQYLIKPSHFLLGYSLPDTQSFMGKSGLFRDLSGEYFTNKILLEYLGNSLGTFWNLIFPYDLTRNIYFLLERSYNIVGNIKIWILSLIPILFSLINLILFRVLRKKELPVSRIIYSFLAIIFFSFIWSFLVLRIETGPIHQASIINGGILAVFLVIISILRIPLNGEGIFLSIIFLIGSLAVFIFAKPGMELESSHRYLIALSYIPSLFLNFFLPREIFYRKGLRKRISIVIFFIPFLTMLTMRFYIGVNTQRDFVRNEANHYSRYFSEIKKHIPEINKKTLIYVEGATRDLNYISGNAVRVGMLSSEASYAVHYRVKIDKIIVPENFNDIRKNFQENKDLSIDNVFTFIYDGEVLRNTSEKTRYFLKSSNLPKFLLRRDFKMLETDEKIILYPEKTIYTVVPLTGKITLVGTYRNEKDSKYQEELYLNWEYNTYGSIYVNKEEKIKIGNNENYIVFKFKIPAGGELLKELSLKGKRKDLRIRDLVLSYE